MTARFTGVSVVLASIFCFTAAHASVYQVMKNDTIWSIARKFNIQAQPISRINDLNGNRLQVGQKLVIPDRLIQYTVRSGDNLIRIARENNSRLPYIILYNNLPDDRIMPGRKIVIPVTETSAQPVQTVKTAPVPERVPSQKISSTHRVVKGDTLTSISEKYNVSISEIMDWNRKRNASIFIGERLRILTGTQDTKEEVIARRENTVPERTEPAATGRLTDPGSYEFPISWNSVDHVSPSGRGMIVYLDGRTEIGCIHDGTVEFAGKMTGYNSVVIINCGDNERAIYGFLNDVHVREGDRVSKKQPVGTVSQATYLGQIQFYFELRKGRENINALDVFPMLKNKNSVARN